MAKKNLQLIKNEGPPVNNSCKMRLEDLITISSKTETQGQFMSQYRHKQAFLLHGCAGTGKTFIALYRALEEVMEKGSGYCRDKVIIVRSAVPSRDIGHLPGDQDEKTEVYSRIVGYFRPIQNWNRGKKQEFKDRKEYTGEVKPIQEVC